MARETAAEKAEREAAEQAEAAVAAAAPVDVESDSKGGKVKVPAAVGNEITFSRGGDVVAQFKVSDGVVTASDEHELQLLLGNVAGAELVEG